MVLLHSIKAFAALTVSVVALTARTVTAAKSLSSVDYVVTGLKAVEAPTLEEALEKCQRSSKYVTAGIDLTLNDKARVVQLCHVKEAVATVAAAQQQQQGKRKVLQRLAVYSAASDCPLGQQPLFAPRNGSVVCAQFASAASAFATGAYVSDLTVTAERNYNNEVPGWETIPFSVDDGAVAATGNKGAFISCKRPVTPITGIQVLSDISAADAAQACSVLFGSDWEQAGQGYADHVTDVKKTVVCLQRGNAQQQKPGAALTLLDVAVVDPTNATCPSEFTQQQTLVNDFRLCTKWGSSPATGVYVADVKLVRLTSNEAGSLKGQSVLPGPFSPAQPQDVNQGRANASVFLVSRKTNPKTFQMPVSSKPPLKARRANELVQGPGALTFKVLQIADMHTTGNPTYPCRNVPTGMNATDCTEALMFQFIDALLDLEKPDLVVFTGDNVEVFTPDLRQAAMNAVTRDVEQRGIPFAMVFGNHDDENGFSREDIVRIAQAMPTSYVQRGPEDVDGVGNYEIGVQAPVDGPWGVAGTDVFRMYFLDSHGYPDKVKFPHVSASYDWVKQSQIDYYRQLSSAHAATKVPALMFFHIPLIEYAGATASKTNGERHEGVYSSDVSTNLFSTLVELNEVKATFVGHDHVNDYCYNREGVQLCYGGGVGFGRAYGGESFARRSRVIEWSVDSANKRMIRSWKRYFGNIGVRQLEEVLYSEA